VENYVKLFGLTAVIALAVGGSFAFSVAMTRWEFIGLLDPSSYYTHLSIHAWNLLIFWMVLLEDRRPLRRRSDGARSSAPASSARDRWVGHHGRRRDRRERVHLAVRGAERGPLLTAYVPLPVTPWFYGAAIVFLLGATIASLPFFATIWSETRDSRRTLPLVAFGAFVTGIIAVEAIFGGIAAFAYALAWRIDLIASVDPGIYRQLYWIVGHGTQQINLLAMITVWYFLTHVVGAPS